MSSPLKRIKDYIDFKRIKISVFEKSVGFSNGLFGGQLKKNKTIGIDKLENILTVYPDLNANWVLTGKESMLRDDVREEATVKYQSTEHELANDLKRNHEEVIASLNDVIAVQQKTISLLEQLATGKERNH
ncbi:hypothetical protein GCM10007415_36420 [Parapedobacter pyrenivorans]|uniref:Uncharacterized protein n=2 Tax=Parapedobacter pyrenivorans TaxID=1305674 RepID=A0A917MFR4_9SPHI|nr:hypothetical protein GCM10007415_36420 [Parapedobacter pyrenivorans]